MNNEIKFIKALTESVRPKNYKIRKSLISIGRNKSSDIVINDKNASRNHAKIYRKQGKYVLEDLNSTNGTFVNGSKITSIKFINSGDLIRIGNSKFQINSYSDRKKLPGNNKLLLTVVICLIVVLIPAIAIPTYLNTKGNLKGEETPAGDKTTDGEDGVNLLVEEEIYKKDEYHLNKGDLELRIEENSLYQDDILNLKELDNDILVEDKYAVFSKKIYNLEFENCNYFNKPVQLTLKYDENMIPEGVSEYSVFVAMEDYEGNIFYQGGEIDTQNNTITINTFHFTNFWTGAFKSRMELEAERLFERTNIEEFSAEDLDLTYEVLKAFDKGVPLEYGNLEAARIEFYDASSAYQDAIEDVVSDMERFDDEFDVPEPGVGGFVSWVGKKYFGKGEGIFFGAGGNILNAFNLTRAGAIFGKASTVWSYFNAGLCVIEFSLAVDYAENVEEKIFGLEKYSNRWLMAQKAMSLLKSEETISNYIEMLRNAGYEITADMIANIYQAYEGTATVENQVTDVSLEKIYGPELEGDLCVYRYKVWIEGEYGDIHWNIDDSNGNYGKFIAQVNLKQGESKRLTVTVIDHFNNETTCSVDLSNPFEYGLEPEPEESDYGTFDFEKLYNDHITAKEAYEIAKDYIWDYTGFDRPLSINTMTGKFVLHSDNQLSSTWELELLDFKGQFTWSSYYIKLNERNVISFTEKDVSEEIIELEDYFGYYPGNGEEEDWRDSRLAIDDFKEYLNNVYINGHKKLSLELFFFPPSDFIGYAWDWKVSFWIDDNTDGVSYGVTGGNRNIGPYNVFIIDDSFK